MKIKAKYLHSTFPAEMIIKKVIVKMSYKEFLAMEQIFARYHTLGNFPELNKFIKKFTKAHIKFNK